MTGPPIIPGVIHAGDMVILTGDPRFRERLGIALGDQVDIVHLDAPGGPPPFRVEGDTVIPPAGVAMAPIRVTPGSPDCGRSERAVILYAADDALQREHVLSLGPPVVIRAESPTFARVLKLGGADVDGVALTINRNDVSVTRLGRLHP